MNLWLEHGIGPDAAASVAIDDCRLMIADRRCEPRHRPRATSTISVLQSSIINRTAPSAGASPLASGHVRNPRQPGRHLSAEPRSRMSSDADGRMPSPRGRAILSRPLL
jgi:hypothetical protein